MPKKNAKLVKDAKNVAEPSQQTVAHGILHGKLLLGLGIVIVLGAVYVFFGQGGSGTSQFANFSHSNSATPRALSSLSNLSGNAATQSLGALAQASFASTNQLTVLYSGNITGHYSLISVKSPFIVFDSKYGSAQKFILNISNVEAFGPLEVAYLNLTNGTFTCTNLNLSAVSSQNYQSALFGSHPMRCSRSGTISGLNFASLADFNFSQLSRSGVQFNYNQFYQSTFRRMPCTYISGSFTISGSGSNGGIFQECISDVYYVPLSLSVYATGKGGSVSILMNETSISNSSYISSIDSMPG